MGLTRAFLAQPTGPRARRIDHFSALWTITLYLLLGVIPLAVKMLGSLP
jgi:hypothetical protein